MTAEPETTRRWHCPVWVKVLLVLSLVANVAVIGLYAGALMQDKKRERGASRQIEWILSFVPEERRADAETLFQDRRDELRRLHRASIDDMAEIVRAIRAEPYSPETLASALSTRQASSIRRREVVQEGLLALMASLSATERRHFADALEAKLERWKKSRYDAD